MGKLEAVENDDRKRGVFPVVRRVSGGGIALAVAAVRMATAASAASAKLVVVEVLVVVVELEDGGGSEDVADGSGWRRR